MKLTLRHPDFCDGCSELRELNTLGRHKRCEKYKFNMLPDEAVFLASQCLGYLKRPEKCKEENEAEVKK